MDDSPISGEFQIILNNDPWSFEVGENKKIRKHTKQSDRSSPASRERCLGMVSNNCAIQTNPTKRVGYEIKKPQT